MSDAAATEGQLTILEQWAPKGFSPPLHVHHREDTALHVLDGELTVLVGDVTRSVGPGEATWPPRDVPDTFRVDSGSAHFLEYATPGGVEDFHIEASDPADAPGLPEPANPTSRSLSRRSPATAARSSAHHCRPIPHRQPERGRRRPPLGRPTSVRQRPGH